MAAVLNAAAQLQDVTKVQAAVERLFSNAYIPAVRLSGEVNVQECRFSAVRKPKGRSVFPSSSVLFRLN